MKKYLVLILLAVIVSSCQDEILNDNNPVIENVNVNLSMDEAMSIAMIILQIYQRMRFWQW